MINRICYFLAVYICLLGLAGCSSSLDYETGLYTKSVDGVFKMETEADQNQRFVLVLDYHKTLIETEQGYLNRVSAFIVYPDEEGKYTAPFSADTVKLELTYYVHNCQIRIQDFHRSLGIGAYKFNVNLREDKDWRNSYYLMIKPTLVEYITEKRFLMNQYDQKFIGDWLSEADARL